MYLGTIELSSSFAPVEARHHYGSTMRESELVLKQISAVFLFLYYCMYDVDLCERKVPYCLASFLLP